MRIRTIKLTNTTIWLALLPLIKYSPELELLETQNEFLCFFKFSEPNPFFFGELLSDENNIPLIFKSEEESVQYAINYLKKSHS